jgi:ribosomal protein S21
VVEVKRKKGESFESLLRRFGKRVQQSGKILEAKKLRFYSPKKSKNALRRSALRRLEIAAKREYLIKSGKMSEEEMREPRRSFHR